MNMLSTPVSPPEGKKPETSQALFPGFDQQAMQSFDKTAFTQRQPFPWYNFQSLLSEEMFARLYDEFPSLDFFEKHEGLPRNFGQRSHDRYYLAYEESIYTDVDHAEKGVIRHEQLSPAWQAFMTGLQTDPGYRGFIRRLLGVSRLFGINELKARYAWHVTTAGRSVSPHVDASDKIGTHIFYFNTSQDWQAAWGGSTLVLSGKQGKSLNPEIADFDRVEAVRMMDNRSFLFKNQPEAWHAVDTISCPPDAYRRIFNVIFELPMSAKVKRRLLNELRPIVWKVRVKSLIGRADTGAN